MRKLRLHWCKKTCCQLQHWSTLDTKSFSRRSIVCVASRDRTVTTHPQSPWNVRDGLRTGAVCDGTKNLAMTGTRPLGNACPVGTRSKWSCLRDAAAREQELRGEAIPEIDHELAAQAEERAPPMLRNRMDRHQCNAKNIEEHTSRIER